MFAMKNSSKPWSSAEEFCEFGEERGKQNNVMLTKDERFGLQNRATLKCIDIL